MEAGEGPPLVTHNKHVSKLLQLSPATLEFVINKDAGVARAVVEVKNLDSQPRSIRIRRPTTKWFGLSGTAAQTVRVAPGLSVKFEVTFDPGRLEPGSRDYHDSIRVASELEEAELWLHARAPQPQLVLEGDLHFGLVALSSRASKQLVLHNPGSLPAEFCFEWDKSLPLSIEPAAGVLAADASISSSGGSSGSSTRVAVVLHPEMTGPIVAELVLAVAGRPEPYRYNINATVVQQTFQLTDTSNTALTELDFGRLFFGEAVTRTIRIFNNGPGEARFDLSYGSTADMKAADGDEAAGPGAADDEVSSFLQVARIRAKAREERDSVLKVTPVTGSVAAYSTTDLQVTFRLMAARDSKGFSAQPLTPPQQAQSFDCLVQVNLSAFGKHLRLPVKGCALAPALATSPKQLQFGTVPCFEWADHLLELANNAAEPMRVVFERSGPYFSAEPADLQLAAQATASVAVRYCPQALGRHQCSLSFQVMSSRLVGKVLFESVVQVAGSSLSLGRKPALPGGLTATPATFSKTRTWVDEGEAALQMTLQATKKTFRRPPLWEAADAAYSQADEQYTSFICAGRLAASRKHLTQPEGNEQDMNMGLHPYKGLSPARLELPRQVEPLWTLKQHASEGPSVQRLPPASALADIPARKPWPETAQEKAECSIALSAAQLSKLMVAPRQLDFGRVSAALPGTATWVITNTLNAAVHVVLDLHSLPELTCAAPAQVVPPGSTAKFQLALRCHEVQQLRERVMFCINGSTLQPLDVVADVVAATLELSCDELLFAFSLDNWDDFVEQTLLLENVHNFPVEFDWALSHSAFSVTPASGTVKPRSSLACSLRWTPGSAASVAQTPKAKPAAASVDAAAPALQTSKPAARADAPGSGKPAVGSSSASGRAAAAPAPASGSAVTVELPPDAAAAADAAEPAIGCQHVGFMALQLKGGGDVPPKKVLLHGELPAGSLKFREKEMNLGPVPLHQQQTLLLQLRNVGVAEAAFRVRSNSLLAVTPERGHVAAESSMELEVQWLPRQQGPLTAVLELEVRGGKPLRLPIRAEGVLPSVQVSEGALAFPATLIGSTAELPLTLVNATPVPATLLCDLQQQPEFGLRVVREVWAAAGYTACPVQRIGANGEMSAVGSQRPSRRITSQGGRSHTAAAACGADGGDQFLIQLAPSSTLPLRMVYRPSKAQACQFALPLTLHNGGGDAAAEASGAAVPASAPGSATSSQPGSARRHSASTTPAATSAEALSPPAAARILAVPVSAAAVVPRVIVSRSSIDFGSKVVHRQQGKSPHTQLLFVRNNTSEALRLAVGAPVQACSTAAAGSPAALFQQAVFSLEGLDTLPGAASFTSLGPESMELLVRFSPAEARSYEVLVPLFLDDDVSAPYLTLALAGAGTLPQLTFSVAECLLPPVPLDVTSRCRFFIQNNGYDNLEVAVRLPLDEGRMPLRLAFPEGNLIGLAKERLPVEVTFKSSRPLAFTGLVGFLDESGRAFTIPITAAADNCSLSHQPFMQANAQRLAGAAEGGCLLRLADSPELEMPHGEAIGPLHLTQGVCKYLAAVTSRSLASGSGSRAGSSNEDGTSAAGPGQDACEALRHAMRSSRGKQLLELVEQLGGKPVSRKGVPSKSSANKVEAAQQLLLLYEAILGHIRQHGGLVNAVKPEYLLDQADFARVLEARGAAAAGNPEQEEALELWAPVEQEFGAYSAQAWNCVLLQVFKIFVLAHVTPAAVRQLLASVDSSKPAAAPEPQAASLARSKSSMAGGTKPAVVAATGGPDDAATPTTTIGSGNGGSVAGAFPSDELLAGSNIFDTAEACLLAWLSAHMAKAFPGVASGVTNFGSDMRNGLALGALLAAHWPGGTAGALLSKLHQTAADGRHLRENQELVVKAMQELCLPFELVAADIQEAEPGHMLLLVAYLFTALPQLLPRATLDFSCKLGEQQVRDITLTNPTRRPLSYTVRLEGAAAFSLEGQMIKIEPGRSTQVPIRFSPSNAKPASCRLVLMSRRDGSSASAATLVFSLRGFVDSRMPLRQVAAQAALYALTVTEFTLTNPFQQDCDFAISILQQPPLAELPAAVPVNKGKPAATTAAKSGSSSSGGGGGGAPGAKKPKPDQAALAAALFPDAFGLERHRLRLRAGASEKLRLSFLPLHLPAPAVQPGADPPVPKSVIRSLLLLTDSECGEFAYELCGEVLQPATFLQQNAKVGLEGPQVVELQLQFTNHLLEAARRTFADKHPLAKDREQAAKLRADIGRSSDRGERQLEYTVVCSNSLISCPARLQLRAGTASPSPLPSAAGGGPRSAGASPAPAPGQAAAAASGGGGRPQQLDPAKDNLLQLSLRPVGCGVYPARITITSAYDVRILDVEITAQSLGQQAMLELEAPARQQVVQKLPLINTSDSPLTVTATLSGGCFSGPREVVVPARSSGDFALAFSPAGTGSFAGSLELFMAATGERNVFSLVGKGSEPLAEGHLLIECQARSQESRRLQVPNITGTLPLCYSVFADLECLSGPATHACNSTSRGDPYKLSVAPLRSGSCFGSISFVAPDGNYCWYSIEVRASEPPGMGLIQVSCPVRQAVAIQVSFTNPSDRPLALAARYDGSTALVGPASFAAPPGPARFECFYTPLLVGREQGVLRLISEEAGEFWWQVEMEATPGGPERLPLLTAAFGRSTSHPVTISNPTAADAAFKATSSDPERFSIDGPSSFLVAANSSVELLLQYMPGSLGREECGRVTVASETAGSVEFICRGQGELPAGCEAASIGCALGSSCTCGDKLSWRNPFSSPATLRVALHSSEQPGTFSLLLPGTQQVLQKQQKQQQLGRQGMEGGSSGGGAAAAEEEADDCFLERAGSGGSPSDAAAGAVSSAADAFDAVLAGSSSRAQPADAPPAAHLQQLAEVSVAAQETLQLPVAFAPRVLREAAAQLLVALVAPAVPSPAPLEWRFSLQGLAHADARGVSFAAKCRAKQTVEQVLLVPLPGLDPATVAEIAAAAALKAAAAADGAGSDLMGAAEGAGDDGSGVQFSCELLLPNEHRAALEAAVSVQQLDRLPVPAGAGDSSTAAAGEAPPPVLRCRLCFAPHKAVATVLQLAVACSSGARWVYPLHLQATAPEVDGVLTLEAHMGCTAELPLMLHSSGAEQQPFTASFTPDSPLNFDVLPAAGLLPPCPGAADGTGGGGGGGGSAPLKITFLCKEMGKVMQGRLVVVTPDSQHTFVVRGRQPAYVAPSRGSRPAAGGPLASTTASSRAKASRSASPAGGVSTVAAAGPAAAYGRDASPGAAGTGGGAVRGSFIKQNIRAAGSAASPTATKAAGASPASLGGASGRPRPRPNNRELPRVLS